MRRPTTNNVVPLEAQSQEAFFDYVRLRAQNDPRYRNVYASELGIRLAGDDEKRVRQMNRLKRRGVLIGVPDIFIAVPSYTMMPCERCDKTRIAILHPGHYIELKRKGGRISKTQKQVHEQLRAVGYLVTVCWSVEEAIATLERYLSGVDVNTMEVDDE